MKILLVSSKYMPEYSGSGFRAHNLYKRLCTRNPEISLRVLCSSSTENDNLAYSYDGFEVMRIARHPYQPGGKGPLRFWRNWRNFEEAYSNTISYLEKIPRPDILHVFGKSYVTAAALIWANTKGIPALIELVNEMNTPFQYVPLPSRLYIPAAFPSRHKIVCISERLKGICIGHRLSEKDLWTRPNPVDETRFHPVSAERKMELRHKLTKFGPDDKLVSYVAKYSDRKNHRFLIDVMKKLPGNYKLFLGGPLVSEGFGADAFLKLYEGIAKAVSENGLEERVQLENGFIENVEDYYQMADVSAFPSKAEGLGTPMLEAVACGVPVVMNRIPGISDSWLQDGQNGFSCELDAEKFASKIGQAAAFPEEQCRAESGKILAAASTKVIDDGYEAILAGLLSEKEPK
ncbi:MAG: hypothetical protein A2X49_05545 [Lentisphaerae bacterium GWF2_52_8]|nr:MAG: hypothetical protein A2X49_05545 [Lentisphaerae bacterium GWF2_52_8]